jgi:hypothetical protein
VFKKKKLHERLPNQHHAYNAPTFLRTLDTLHLAGTTSKKLIIAAPDRQLLDSVKTTGVQCKNIATAE